MPDARSSTKGKMKKRERNRNSRKTKFNKKARRWTLGGRFAAPRHGPSSVYLDHYGKRVTRFGSRGRVTRGRASSLREYLIDDRRNPAGQTILARIVRDERGKSRTCEKPKGGHFDLSK